MDAINHVSRIGTLPVSPHAGHRILAAGVAGAAGTAFGALSGAMMAVYVSGKDTLPIFNRGALIGAVLGCATLATANWLLSGRQQ
jgi:hypothetical protein